MLGKLGLGTREIVIEKIAKLQGLWVSREISEEEFPGETEWHQSP